MSDQGREPGQADPWRTRRVMRLYASGENITLISRSVGWSEGVCVRYSATRGWFSPRRGCIEAQGFPGGAEEAARSRLGGEDAGRAGRLATPRRERKLVFTRGGVRDIGGNERGASGGVI